MTRLTTASVIGALLIGGQALAQTTTPPVKPPAAPPATQTPPAKPPTPPATGAQTPATGAQTPATPAPPPPPKPFVVGSKVAIVNFQYIASESQLGKNMTARMNAFKDQKGSDLQKLNEGLKALQDKQKASGVMTEAAAADLQRQVDRQNAQIQLDTQDANKQADDLNNQLMSEFYSKVIPVVDVIAKEYNIEVVLDAGNPAVVWVKDGLDISVDVVKRLDVKKLDAPSK